MLVGEQRAQRRRRGLELLNFIDSKFLERRPGGTPSFVSASAGSQFGSSLSKSVRAVAMIWMPGTVAAARTRSMTVARLSGSSKKSRLSMNRTAPPSLARSERKASAVPSICNADLKASQPPGITRSGVRTIARPSVSTWSTIIAKQSGLPDTGSPRISM